MLINIVQLANNPFLSTGPENLVLVVKNPGRKYIQNINQKDLILHL
jgi:hypothetical protein